MALNFNQFATEANTFINAYTEKLNIQGDTDKGGRILSSILHGLRELIPVHESLQLIAQFPMFLKAVYVNGWSLKPRSLARVKRMDEFIDLIREYNGITGDTDFPDDELAERYIHTTFIMLKQYVSLGELEDIRTSLPKDLKSMIYQDIMF